MNGELLGELLATFELFNINIIKYFCVFSFELYNNLNFMYPLAFFKKRAC